MFDGIKINSMIYVGDYIVRESDARLNNDDDIVAYTGSKNRACDTKSGADDGTCKWREHIGTNNADKEGTSAKN